MYHFVDLVWCSVEMKKGISLFAFRRNTIIITVMISTTITIITSITVISSITIITSVITIVTITTQYVYKSFHHHYCKYCQYCLL